MPDQVTPNADQRAVLERGNSFELLFGVPGVKDELLNFLNERVRDDFLALLATDDTNEMLRLQGQLRANLQLTERLDAARGDAKEVAAYLRASVESHRERQRERQEEELQRHHRRAATAEA